MLNKMWDDSVGGPQPDRGLNSFRNNSAGKMQVTSLDVDEMSGKAGSEGNRPISKPPNFYQRSLSMESNTSTTSPSSPTAPSSSSPSSTPRDQENIWRSVFHPGSNSNTKSIGSEKFDKPEPKSPTVYDWLYREDTKNKWR